MLAEQKRELDSAVEALAESKARMMVVDIKDKLNDGDVDGAERQLTEVLWLRPDYPPALEVRAQLLEQRARAVAARQQWHALTNATNAALAAQAKGESEARRLDAGSPSVPASVPEPPPAPLSTSVPPAEINEPVSAVPGPSAPIGTVDGPGTE